MPDNVIRRYHFGSNTQSFVRHLDPKKSDAIIWTTLLSQARTFNSVDEPTKLLPLIKPRDGYMVAVIDKSKVDIKPAKPLNDFIF